MLHQNELEVLQNLKEIKGFPNLIDSGTTTMINIKLRKSGETDVVYFIVMEKLE